MTAGRADPMSSPSPRRAVIGPALLALAFVGLTVSGLMLYLYLSPEAGACGPGGGCETVRSSRYSALWGVPLPYLGLAYFGALCAVLVVPPLRRRGLLVALGLGGAASGLTFLTLQGLVLGAWCPYCVVVDACAVGAGLAVAPGLDAERPRRTSVLVAVVLAGLAPALLLSAFHTPPPEPVIGGPAPVVARVTPVEGQATIVDFVDFECPYCRRQHARLTEILADYGERVRVITKHDPLPMHPHAREAARFACCAEEQGAEPGHAMADALFTHDDLSEAGCFECARQVGLNQAALRECLQSDRPDARLRADQAEAARAEVRQLPTCFIGDQRFEGLQSEATLREAIEAALVPDAAST